MSGSDHSASAGSSRSASVTAACWIRCSAAASARPPDACRTIPARHTTRSRPSRSAATTLSARRSASCAPRTSPSRSSAPARAADSSILRPRPSTAAMAAPASCATAAANSGCSTAIRSAAIARSSAVSAPARRSGSVSSRANCRASPNRRASTSPRAIPSRHLVRSAEESSPSATACARGSSPPAASTRATAVSDVIRSYGSRCECARLIARSTWPNLAQQATTSVGTREVRSCRASRDTAIRSAPATGASPAPPLRATSTSIAAPSSPSASKSEPVVSHSRCCRARLVTSSTSRSASPSSPSSRP